MSDAPPRRWHVLLAAALPLAGACHADTTGPGGPTVAAVAGAYALRSVYGDTLPVASLTGTSVVTPVSQATRTLDADGTCRESGTYATQYPFGPRESFTGTAMTCTWTLSGRTVTFRLVSSRLSYGGFASTTTATYADDGTLTETSTYETGGLALYPRVYRR